MVKFNSQLNGALIPVSRSPKLIRLAFSFHCSQAPGRPASKPAHLPALIKGSYHVYKRAIIRLSARLSDAFHRRCARGVRIQKACYKNVFAGIAHSNAQLFAT